MPVPRGVGTDLGRRRGQLGDAVGCFIGGCLSGCMHYRATVWRTGSAAVQAQQRCQLSPFRASERSEIPHPAPSSPIGGRAWRPTEGLLASAPRQSTGVSGGLKG